MRAVVARAAGEPRDVLAVADVPSPALGAGEVRIATEAVGLNFLEVSMARGEYPVTERPPLVIGAELAGRVVEVAADVSPGLVGRRVAALHPERPFGALAEEVVVPATMALPVPETVPATVASVLLVTYQTAWFALHRRARLQSGETLLVHAGAGGVGTAVTQVARSVGARVFATTRGEAKAQVCREQGAELVVDLDHDDFVEAVQEVTDGVGVDVICDPVGGELFARSLECLAFEGRMLPLGTASGEPPKLDVIDLLARNHDVIGLGWGSEYPSVRPDLVRDAHQEILALLERGAIDPVISQIVPLEEVPASLQRLADGETTGKIVATLQQT